MILEEDLSIKGVLLKRKDFLGLDKNAQTHPNRTYYYRRDGESTIDICTRAIELDPSNRKNFIQRGAILLRSGQYSLAINDFSSVLASDPRNIESLFNRGVSYSKLGEHEAAILDLSTVLLLCPEHFNAAFERAVSYNFLGLFSAAIEDYTFALSKEESLFQLDERTRERRQKRMLGIEADDPNSPTRSPSRLSPINSPCPLSAPSSSSTSSCASPVHVVRNMEGWVVGRTSSLNSKNNSNRYLTNNNTSSVEGESNDNDNDDSSSTSCSIDDGVLDSLDHALALMNLSAKTCDEQDDINISKNREDCGIVEEDRAQSPNISSSLDNDNDSKGRNIAIGVEGTKMAGNMMSTELEARMRTDVQRGRTEFEDDEDKGKDEDEDEDKDEDIGNVEVEKKQNQTMQLEAKKNEELLKERECSSEDHHTRGYILRKAGKYDRAIVEYSRAITILPTHFRALFNRAFAYDKVGLVELAVADYTTALSLQPENAFAYYNRGISLDRMGERTRAIDDFTNAISFKSDCADFYHNRAYSYEKLGFLDKAAMDYTTSLSIRPLHPKTLYSRALCRESEGDFHGALEDHSSLLLLQPGHLNSIISRATLLDKLDRTSDSLSDISSALEIYRVNKQNLVGMNDSKNKSTVHVKSWGCSRNSSSGHDSLDGCSDEETKEGVGKKDRDTWSHEDGKESRGSPGPGELVDRRRNWEGRQSRSVSLLSLLFFRASLYTKLSQSERAILDLSEAISIPPDENINSQQFVKSSLRNDDRFHLFLSRGMCFKSLGQYSEAIKDFSESLLLSESYIDALSCLGTTSGEEETSNEKNENSSSQTSDSNNTNMSHTRNIDGSYTQSNYSHTPKAMGSSSSKSKSKSNDHNRISAHIAHKSPLLLSLASCLAHRGYCLRKVNQLKSSVEDYSQVIEITPHNVQAYINRAYVFGKMEMFREAVADYTTAISLDPGNTHAYHNRGISLDRLGSFDVAIKDFSTVLELESKHQ